MAVLVSIIVTVWFEAIVGAFFTVIVAVLVKTIVTAWIGSIGCDFAVLIWMRFCDLIVHLYH